MLTIQKCRVVLGGIFVLFLLAVTQAGCQESKEAIQFHNGVDRTGAFQTKGVPAIRGLLWKFMTSGEVWSSPILADGIIYIGSDDMTFYAVDAQTGQEKWRYKTAGNIRSAAAVYDGRVYFTSFDGSLYALDAKTGILAWKLDMQEGVIISRQQYDDFTSSPLIVDDNLFVGSLNPRKGFFAVRAKTGKVIWNYKTSTADTFNSSAAYSNGLVYFGGWNALYALEAKTGKEEFRIKIVQTASYTPAIFKGLVYFSSKDTFLYAVNASNGDVIWRTKLSGSSWVTSSPAIANGMVYAGTSDGHKLFAVAADSGEIKWKFKTGGYVWSSPVFADGIVYVGSVDKKLYAVDALTGDEIWEYETGGGITSSPLVSDGVVYVGSRDGYLYALH